MSDIASPCVGLCLLSEDKSICVGCFRTRAEITRWSKLTDKQKLTVVKQLDNRKRSHSQK